ncbi:MAG TPA: helix-turn-helix transcriptional regulator [Lachnospiraceae bacterium]|nr:helix-turn-helix transcriptional regulator [Lachnospiraceae bacterium]
MKFQPELLISLRKSLEINKSEAARRLNMSAMGYGRYESGEREPSFQTVSFIAQTFGTTSEYLYGESENMQADAITILQKDNPELFALVQAIQTKDEVSKRLFSYYKKLCSPNS